MSNQDKGNVIPLPLPKRRRRASKPLPERLEKAIARATKLLAEANESGAVIPGEWLETALVGLITEAAVMAEQRFPVSPPRREDS